YLGMALGNSGQHHIIRELIGACFNHYDLVHTAGDRKLQSALLALLTVGADNILAVGITHLKADYWAVPGDIGYRKCHRCAYHGGNFGRVVMIYRKDGAHNGDIVAHVGGEEGPYLPVYKAGYQNSLLA